MQLFFFLFSLLHFLFIYVFFAFSIKMNVSLSFIGQKKVIKIIMHNIINNID